MKILLITLLVCFLVAISGVEAVSWVNSCINSTHMIQESELNISDVVYPIQQIIPCEYNCSSITKTCNPAPQDVSASTAMPVLLTILAAAAILVFISFNIKKSYTAMGILYLILPLVFIIAALSIAAATITAESQSPFQNTISTISLAIIVILVITVLVFLVKIIRDAINPEKRKEELKEL